MIVVARKMNHSASGMVTVVDFSQQSGKYIGYMWDEDKQQQYMKTVDTYKDGNHPKKENIESYQILIHY